VVPRRRCASSRHRGDGDAREAYPFAPFLPAPSLETSDPVVSAAAYTQLCWKLQLLELAIGGLAESQSDTLEDDLEAIRNTLTEVRELAPWFGGEEMTARLAFAAERATRTAEEG